MLCRQRCGCGLVSGFDPIAIVGRGCVLPGATTPQTLFDAALHGRCLISPTPRDRWGGVDPELLLNSGEPGLRVASATGGYVADVDYDLADIASNIADFERLDPIVHWLAHCARQALGTPAAPSRTGLIVGNLSYPTTLATAFVESIWTGHGEVDPRNRFSSGLPVHLVAQAMHMTGPAFALDAACASSLYAIKFACDALQDGEADTMLAGGVNGADDLFLHLGFTALQALSPTGRSRPFHAEADGLVPAQGAALVVLKRLEDAERMGDRIFGVIVGIGLSNDGRQSGFLAPAPAGQIRAMKAALEQADLEPTEVDFVDCHATGTALGDATELESLLAAYGDTPLMLGALKGNLGHSITASGAASLLNMLSAMEESLIPPALCDAPTAALKDTPFTLPNASVPWPKETKRAAVSNFGFGGNNAHLIVQNYRPSIRCATRQPPPSDEIAICGLGVVTGDAPDTASFRRRVLGPPGTPTPMDTVELDFAGLGFPPSELKACLSQQTAMLAAATQALEQVGTDPDRTGVIVGMGCDATIARQRLRVQHAADDEWLAANEQAAPRLTADGVLGAMPNIPANRIHAQRDFRGFGFTVSSEQVSGITALRLAARALRRRELDAVVAGAVDMCCEPAHTRATDALSAGTALPHGDAAVAFVLKRRVDAEAAGEEVIALIDTDCVDSASAENIAEGRFGRTHAASAATEIAALTAALRARVRVDQSGAKPSPGRNRAAVWLKSLGDCADGVVLAAVNDPPEALAVGAIPISERYAGDSRNDLLRRMARREPGGNGPVRCALVADSDSALDALLCEAVGKLDRGRTPGGPGVAFTDAPIVGEIAFAFTGAAAAYPGAAPDLLLAWPEIGDALVSRHSSFGEDAHALYGAGIATLQPRAQLTGCSLVCQAHSEFSRTVLGLVPSAAIGLSSGETNALLAFGVWRDLGAMLDEIDASGLYDEQLTGRCRAVASEWGLADHEPALWKCWRITAPRAALEAALAAEPRAYLTIVQAPDDCVIGGDPAACRRVIDAIGGARAMALGLDMVIHCRAMAPFAQAWRRIHTRETHEVPNVRFYTNADNCAYSPTRDSAAEALTRQALEPIDFPKTVLNAWEDGVRTFVEHGPRGILTGAITKILGDRAHLAVALDPRERRGIGALAETVSKLWVHGLPVHTEAFDARLQQLREQAAPAAARSVRKLTLTAHRPDIVSATKSSGAVDVPMAESDAEGFQPMPPAPQQPTPLVFAHVETHSSAPHGNTGAAIGLVTSVSAAHKAFIVRAAQAHASFLKTRSALFAAASGWRSMPPADALTAAAPSMQRPLYSRAQLETLAGGRISEVFGPLFAQQDGYPRQVRMPQPPLLLADRVMSIEGEAGSMGTGRIVTETDVDPSAWYMHAGRMSPGAVIESGQADLLLASWLGADFANRGERVYRLLGCDLTFMGELPRGGETLRYDIHIDGHAQTGETRLFFFHYDSYVGDRLMISVRNGQAGFFSDEELSQSAGVLWDAASDTPRDGAAFDEPPGATRKRSFGCEDLDAFSQGRAFACFGTGFEMTAAHVRTPTIPGGQLRLIDDVVAFDPEGGPWGRGYLRARAIVPQNAWFYDGHFKNDPCMPGTLMADAATQALSFTIAAFGFTIDRDGWRFEPVPEETARFVCRGQVTPDSDHELTYEVFVEEIINGPTPTVFAALICSSDGFKVFHCRRFGLRLVPDWPMPPGAPGPVQLVGNSRDVRGDHGALLACARGKPSDAFGALYASFDGVRRAPRLPGEPYHFVSRIVSVDGVPGEPTEGGTVVAEYDVPADAWYFTDAGSAAVPLSVLVEILLQPCGWLASYMGFAANRADDVAFRNLDGTDVVLHKPASIGVLRVTACLERFAHASGSTIVFFDVVCAQDGDDVMSMKTAFGFFSPAALATQVGLPAKPGTNAAPAPAAVCVPYEASALSGAPWLGQGRLRLIDRVSFWPSGGARGLGRLIGEADVDPEAWFFRAHFFQDPVQPGSLGLEAMQQAARAAVRLSGLADGFAVSEFEPVAVRQPFSWKFRGQMLPTNTRTRTEIEILSVTKDSRGVLILFEGAFWVDKLRIYEASGMGVRIVEL
ncbi:Phthiocerol synthesis polyketide synthase type I PpsA [Mycobacterium simulans]|uniref:Phthiocerol synthesis polyketide synthase type I PpsA n=1 Tax=Mycobacterium simulans TaxID=627089 RepID=A0A7Z7N8L4_9MYCO|nr:Phthiocerol synthesis polyketide synthase type I PpsA [Mycobacterium simulans]